MKPSYLKDTQTSIQKSTQARVPTAFKGKPAMKFTPS